MMLRDLAAEANLAPAQAHAYLLSYRRANLVEQDIASGMYRLGPIALRLALTRMRCVEPMAMAAKRAVSLSEDLGLMVALVVWGPKTPTTVQVHEGAHTLNINVRPGTVFSVTGSAGGRIFGAFAGTETVRQRIQQELDGEAKDIGIGVRASRAEFDAEIVRIERQGYSTVSGMPVPGINAVAAPVFDDSGTLALVLTLIGPTDALDLGPASRAIAELLSTCRELSQAASTN